MPSRKPNRPARRPKVQRPPRAQRTAHKSSAAPSQPTSPRESQHDSEEQTLDPIDALQQRLGRELHDGLCPHLAGLEFRLHALAGRLRGTASLSSADASREVSELARLAREGTAFARRLAHGWSPVFKSSDQLSPALMQLAEHVERDFGCACSCVCPRHIPLIEPTHAHHLYRLTQEAVHNAVRHGRARSIAIRLQVQPGQLRLSVTDDGVGMPARGRKPRSLELKWMSQRAREVRGKLTVKRRPQGGTAVVCIVPLTVPRAQRQHVLE